MVTSLGNPWDIRGWNHSFFWMASHSQPGHWTFWWLSPKIVAVSGSARDGSGKFRWSLEVGGLPKVEIPISFHIIFRWQSFFWTQWLEVIWRVILLNSSFPGNKKAIQSRIGRNLSLLLVSSSDQQPHILHSRAGKSGVLCVPELN